MVSVICPVYNEAPYIENILKFFVNAEPVDKELLMIDGNSTDGTTEIIKKWAAEYSNIHLVENPHRFVPHGLNKAIKLCKGEIIIRLDGHSEYAPDFFEKVLSTFSSVDTDIVGGPMRTKGINSFQRAVAYATCTSLGIGNSKFHNIDYRGYSDHVYLGSWHKEIFDTLGFFDERLTVDHDEDFSYRARSMGKKIFINPDIRSFYYPRATASKLFIQYFKYGFEKPMVFFNVPSQIKMRHLIPPAFALYVIALPLSLFYKILFIPALLYLVLNVFYSFKNPGPLKEKLLTMIVYPIIHTAYGLGVLTGLFNFKGILNKPDNKGQLVSG